MGLNWVMNFAMSHLISHTTMNSIDERENCKKFEDNDHKKLMMTSSNNGFVMPLHYPRYKKQDYAKMDVEKIDTLLRQYGFCDRVKCTLDEKRRFVMGTFLWQDNEDEDDQKMVSSNNNNGYFQMPLHYPRYSKDDYVKMEEEKIDMLLMQYGLDCHVKGTLDEKRRFAIGTFLWGVA